MTELVKYRTVVISVYPWKHSSGRDYWRYKANGKHVTRSSLAAAKKDALEYARSIFRGGIDMDALSPQQVKACQRLIEADPTCHLIDEFLAWHSRRVPKKPTADAIAEFLREKRGNAGTSPHNVTTLKRCLALLPGDMMLSDIGPRDLPPLTGSPRTRRNIRAAWVTFFKWAVEREYLPHGEKTAAERIGKPIVARGVPATYTPAELAILLSNVRQQYLPWLALCAFGGLRTEEVIPQQGSRKPPLAWEDIHFDRDIIIVRAETAKTGQRRVIPLCPTLRSWLEPIAGKGIIGPHLYPSKPSTHGTLAETTRLGTFIGGWRRNALRHSFISYRAAQCGSISQAASEAGNSESEARRSYNDAKSKAEADEWFSIAQCSPNVLHQSGIITNHSDSQNGTIAAKSGT